MTLSVRRGHVLEDAARCPTFDVSYSSNVKNTFTSHIYFVVQVKFFGEPGDYVISVTP